MGCFLSDKTITLHDLANNGLLQLDQIRSYNTLSVYSNHSSDDNTNDQKKENEEEFLDEIDTSSRRSANKFNDQNSISKRLTDTTISTRQTTGLKSPQSSKNSSDDKQRKSSLSSDTTDELKDKKFSGIKQQRRQTVAVSTISSRLSNQTITKKTSKCKNIQQRNSFIFISTPLI